MHLLNYRRDGDITIEGLGPVVVGNEPENVLKELTRRTMV